MKRSVLLAVVILFAVPAAPAQTNDPVHGRKIITEAINTNDNVVVVRVPRRAVAVTARPDGYSSIQRLPAPQTVPATNGIATFRDLTSGVSYTFSSALTNGGPRLPKTSRLRINRGTNTVTDPNQ